MVQYNKKEDFLEAVTVQIRCKKAKNLVTEEISQHIEDQKNAYLGEGDDGQTAMHKALEQMGDPVDIGKQLNRVHRPRMEWSLLLSVLVLCCLGILAQLSLDHTLTGVTLPNSVNVEQHILFLFLGIAVMSLTYFLDYTLLGRYPKIICLLFIAGFFLYAPFSPMVNGSLRHIYAYAILFIPVFGGILYAYRNKGYIGLVKCLLLCVLTCFLEMNFVVQSSVYLGVLLSGLILLSVAAIKNWFGTERKITLALIWGWIPVAYGLLLLSGVSLLGEYKMMRLEAYINNILHSGFDYKDYQLGRAANIIAHAKLFGGIDVLGDDYLPGFNTEYILTYVIGKWGIAAGILMIALFAAIIVRMLYLVYHQKNSLGMLVGLGCCLVYAVQGSIYILSNLGLQLVAQVNLPFISYGGSSLLVNFAVLGLYLSIMRNTNIIKEVPYAEKFIVRVERVK